MQSNDDETIKTWGAEDSQISGRQAEPYDVIPTQRSIFNSGGDILGGWVKIYRKITENFMWLSEPFTRGQAWVDMILLANHADAFFFVRGVRVDVQRGQLAWAENNLALRWKWSRTKLRTFLKMLEKEQQIIIKKSNVIQILTIVNYGIYQEKEPQIIQQKDRRKTAERPQKDTNKKNKKEENVKKEDIVREDASAPSDHTSFVQYTFDAFKNRYGEKMMFDGGKDGKIVKQLLATYGLERLKELWDDFMQSDDDFLDNVSGRSIGVFKTQINKLITHKGPVMPVESYMDKVKRQQGLL